MKSKFIKTIITICFMLYATVLIAQEDFEDDVPDNTPAAPIDDWVIAVLGISLGVMFFYFKSLTKTKIE